MPQHRRPAAAFEAAACHVTNDRIVQDAINTADTEGHLLHGALSCVMTLPLWPP